MKEPQRFSVNVLFLREGDGWTAQGLDYDIAAQGTTIKEAQDAFAETFIGQVVVNLAHGKQALEDVESAPLEYFRMFVQCGTKFGRAAEPIGRPDQIPPAFVIEANERRLTERVC